MKDNKMKLIGLLLILMLVVLVACAPDEDPAPDPAPGGNGDPQQPGGTAMASLEMVNRISDEWKQSGKMFALPYPAQRESCGVACHDGYAFSTGEFTEPENYVEAGRHLIGIDCQACHTGTGLALMESGLVEVPFADEAIEQGTGAMCVTCHHGRRDTRAAFEEFNAGTAERITYPHYGPAAVTTGLGGMEYPEVTYESTVAHSGLENSCLACHMPETAEGYSSHTFTMDTQYAEQSCGTCHQGITDFNLNGFQDQVRGWLDVTYDALIEETGAVSIASGGGQLNFYANEAATETLPAADISIEVFVAAYNWYMIKTDGSYGVHNPGYTKSLLQESYQALTGEELQ